LNPVTLELGDVPIEIVFKDIKNVHLSVFPPTGRVRISAPERTSEESLRLFAISQLGWIRRQQKKLLDQERETEREYLERESHYVWGKRYLLKVVDGAGASYVEKRHSSLVLHVRAGADTTARAMVLAAWHRKLLREAVPPLIALWEPRLGVRASGFYIQRMKTCWGSCNPKAGTIRLNTELAKKPFECLEYIVVHELTHLIDATHGPTFVQTLDRVYPNWRETRELLNRLPVRQETWTY
jgi:predicted metal-dependent hydrolase